MPVCTECSRRWGALKMAHDISRGFVCMCVYVCLCVCMFVCIDGWMHGWVDGLVRVYTHRYLD